MLETDVSGLYYVFITVSVVFGIAVIVFFYIIKNLNDKEEEELKESFKTLR